MHTAHYRASFTVLLIITFAAVMLLTGCASMPGLSPTGTSSVCDALVGPIQYNSVRPQSPRHAGSALAPDLKRRNQVGVNLKCPAFK